MYRLFGTDQNKLDARRVIFTTENSRLARPSSPLIVTIPPLEHASGTSARLATISRLKSGSLLFAAMYYHVTTDAVDCGKKVEAGDSPSGIRHDRQDRKIRFSCLRKRWLPSVLARHPNPGDGTHQLGWQRESDPHPTWPTPPLPSLRAPDSWRRRQKGHIVWRWKEH